MAAAATEAGCDDTASRVYSKKEPPGWWNNRGVRNERGYTHQARHWGPFHCGRGQGHGVRLKQLAHPHGQLLGPLISGPFHQRAYRTLGPSVLWVAAPGPGVWGSAWARAQHYF